jgi:chromosome segregation ATPase
MTDKDSTPKRDFWAEDRAAREAKRIELAEIAKRDELRKAERAVEDEKERKEERREFHHWRREQARKRGIETESSESEGERREKRKKMEKDAERIKELEAELATAKKELADYRKTVHDIVGKLRGWIFDCALSLECGNPDLYKRVRREIYGEEVDSVEPGDDK